MRSVPPVDLPELSRALQARYAAVVRSELDETRIEQLTRWAAAASPRTQRELAEMWNLSQGTVSVALATLVDAGYVIARPRQGNSPIQYALSGKSRIVAGLE